MSSWSRWCLISLFSRHLPGHPYLQAIFFFVLEQNKKNLCGRKTGKQIKKQIKKLVQVKTDPGQTVVSFNSDQFPSHHQREGWDMDRNKW